MRHLLVGIWNWFRAVVVFIGSAILVGTWLNLVRWMLQ